MKTPHGDVPVAFDGPKDAAATVVLGNGAGSNMNSEFMTFMADELAADGLRVCRFDFVYTTLGRKAPDRQPVLEETYRAVVGAARADGPDRALVLGGKSMGGRIASHVVAAGEPADGLAFLGYPLHPPGKPERIRDAHLLDIGAPMLFIEGTRDPFCPLDTLEKVRTKLRAVSEVAVIEGGDHSFKVPKSSGRTTRDAWKEAAAALSGWVDKLAG